MTEMNRILYIGMDVSHGVKTGGEYCVMMNQTMLRNLYGAENVVSIDIPKIPMWKHMINLLFLNSYGYTRKIGETLKKALQDDYSFACIDGAYYGGLVKQLHNREIKSFVFCHNVEYNFSKHRFLTKKSFFNWILWKYMAYNEKKTCRYCSHLITLNARDSEEMKKLYGRQADLILPSFYFSKPLDLLKSRTQDQKYILFVGSDFYANNEGIIWFIKEVSNHINVPLRVAGSCCRVIKETIDIEKYPNVSLLGFVDDLQSLYINAIGVVGPIFSGSGMKTKTIEAMMYGKNIYATSESFEGIDVDYNKIGALCNSKEEFVKALSALKEDCFNDYTYSVFMKNYSSESAYSKFSQFIDITVK